MHYLGEVMEQWKVADKNIGDIAETLREKQRLVDQVTHLRRLRVVAQRRLLRWSHVGEECMWKRRKGLGYGTLGGKLRNIVKDRKQLEAMVRSHLLTTTEVGEDVANRAKEEAARVAREAARQSEIAHHATTLAETIPGGWVEKSLATVVRHNLWRTRRADAAVECREWPMALEEDRAAHSARGFLAAPWADVRRVMDSFIRHLPKECAVDRVLLLPPPLPPTGGPDDLIGPDGRLTAAKRPDGQAGAWEDGDGASMNKVGQLGWWRRKDKAAGALDSLDSRWDASTSEDRWLVSIALDVVRRTAMSVGLPVSKKMAGEALLALHSLCAVPPRPRPRPRPPSYELPRYTPKATICNSQRYSDLDESGGYAGEGGVGKLAEAWPKDNRGSAGVEMDQGDEGDEGGEQDTEEDNEKDNEEDEASGSESDDGNSASKRSEEEEGIEEQEMDADSKVEAPGCAALTSPPEFPPEPPRPIALVDPRTFATWWLTSAWTRQPSMAEASAKPPPLPPYPSLAQAVRRAKKQIAQKKTAAATEEKKEGGESKRCSSGMGTSIPPESSSESSATTCEPASWRSLWGLGGCEGTAVAFDGDMGRLGDRVLLPASRRPFGRHGGILGYAPRMPLLFRLLHRLRQPRRSVGRKKRARVGQEKAKNPSPVDPLKDGLEEQEGRSGDGKVQGKLTEGNKHDLGQQGDSAAVSDLAARAPPTLRTPPSRLYGYGGYKGSWLAAPGRAAGTIAGTFKVGKARVAHRVGFRRPRDPGGSSRFSPAGYYVGMGPRAMWRRHQRRRRAGQDRNAERGRRAMEDSLRDAAVGKQKLNLHERQRAWKTHLRDLKKKVEAAHAAEVR